MASRQGGEVGVVRDSVSASQCSSYGFRSTPSRVRIAFYGLFFVVYATLACSAAARLFQSRNMNRAFLRWWALGISMLFGLTHIILAIIFFSLFECEVGNLSTARMGNIATVWLYEFSQYLLVAVVMVPILKHLHRHAGKTANMITTVHTCYLTMLATLLIATLGLYTYIVHAGYTDNYYDWNVYKVLPHYQRLTVAFYALEVIGILMAAANMIGLMNQNSSRWSASLKAPVIAIAVAALGMTLLSLAATIDSLYMLHSSSYAADSSNAEVFFGFFFYSCTFAAAVSIAAYRESPEDVHAYPPVQSGIVEMPYDTPPRYQLP